MAKLEGVKTLDMVNGEITKVAYDGAEYERVEGKAEVGDIVLITTIGWTDAREGEFYKAVGVDSDGDAKIKDDRGTIDSHFRCNYGLFRKVGAGTNPSVEERVAKAEGEIESLKSDVAALKGAAEPKPERLKVGDYAKVVDVSNSVSERGDIVRIIEDDKSAAPFLAEKINGNNAGWFHEYELVRATDEEVDEAKRVAAEPAERKKWAEIGRKVGEYKVGDVVSYDDPIWFKNSGIGEVIGFSLGEPQVRSVNSRGNKMPYYLDPVKLRLITPVEARFDR